MPFDMSRSAMDAKALRRAKRRQGRLRGRAEIVVSIVEVIREDRNEGVCPTLLNHEGALVASLRSGLCLLGWGWQTADTAAREIVAEAFHKAGACRPSWREAQPEWSDGGVIRTERTTCANCGKGLDLGQKLYCSKTCFDAYRARVWRVENLEKARAIERLRRKRGAG